MAVFNDCPPDYPGMQGYQSFNEFPNQRAFTSFNEMAYTEQMIENGVWDWVKSKFGIKDDQKYVVPPQQVDSSYLAKVGYDSNRSILTVMFWDGSVFEYSNVSEGDYRTLMNATSHGQWFYWNIRTAKPWRQIESRKTTSRPGFATRLKSKSSEWTGSPW